VVWVESRAPRGVQRSRGHCSGAGDKGAPQGLAVRPPMVAVELLVSIQGAFCLPGLAVGPPSSILGAVRLPRLVV
jgi:hypothetical protein